MGRTKLRRDPYCSSTVSVQMMSHLCAVANGLDLLRADEECACHHLQLRVQGRAVLQGNVEGLH